MVGAERESDKENMSDREIERAKESDTHGEREELSPQTGHGQSSEKENSSLWQAS